MNKKFSARVLIFFVFVCFLCSLYATGCEPLRKKFIRKKKKDNGVNEIVPVLEPEEYPVKSISPQEQYRYHYSLWRVWYKDLMQAVDENGSKKRQLYLLRQEIKQLNRMSELLVEEKRQLFVPIIAELKALSQQIQLPTELRNRFVIKKKLRDIDRQLHDNLRPKMMIIFIKK